MVTTTQSAPAVPAERSVTTTTRTTSGGKRRRKRKPRRVRAVAGGVLDDYAATLTDPWNNAPVQLGFGTMVSTGISTGYFRSSATVNADGSIALLACPGPFQGFLVNNNGLGVATWTPNSCSNLATVQSIAQSFRTVSIGVRAFPSLPETSNAGMVYYGSLGSDAFDANGLTPTQLIGSNYSEIAPGQYGAIATGRPVGPRSYDFIIPGLRTTSAYNVTETLFSIPYIIFTGLPAGTSVFFEFVINMEYLPQDVGGDANRDDVNNNRATLSDLFPSVESAWKAVSSLLPVKAARAGFMALLGNNSDFRRTRGLGVPTIPRLMS